VAVNNATHFDVAAVADSVVLSEELVCVTCIQVPTTLTNQCIRYAFARKKNPIEMEVVRLDPKRMGAETIVGVVRVIRQEIQQKEHVARVAGA